MFDSVTDHIVSRFGYTGLSGSLVIFAVIWSFETDLTGFSNVLRGYRLYFKTSHPSFYTVTVLVILVSLLLWYFCR